MGWKSAAAFLVFSVFGVGSLVYLLLNRDEEFYDDFLSRASEITVREVKVPKDSIGIVIGRGGNTIHGIEYSTNTSIRINDDDSGDYKICLIKGLPECVVVAESMIHELIVNQPLIETYEMFIPVQACGRLIGKHGDTIRMISRNSNAKITLERAPSSPVSFERKLMIKGTAEQIALAKILVEQKLEEEAEFRNQLESQVSNRAPRNKSNYLLPAKNKEEEINSYKHKEKFVTIGCSQLLEVYVSAIETPDRMWLQVMGPCTIELDRLNEEMTDYYSKSENRELHKLKEVHCGQIVAAPFAYDNKWYRAKVLEVEDNSESEDSNILLYYVDYGDTCHYKKGDVYKVRTDFLRLKYQAIECMLAKIKPRESTWSEEAVELLGDLTHVAMWKSLMAKILEYQERPTKWRRQGSPIPCVELYDLHGEKTVNVAEELVEKGFAVWEEGSHKQD